METLKTSVIKDYDQLDEKLKEQVKLFYPMGFNNALVEITNAKRKKIIAIRFETEEKIYMLRLSKKMAKKIMEENREFDNDYN